MKKTYIIPEAISISLDPKMPLLLGYSRSMGEEGVFTKEYSSDGTTTTTSGSKKAAKPENVRKGENK